MFTNNGVQQNDLKIGVQADANLNDFVHQSEKPVFIA